MKNGILVDASGRTLYMFDRDAAGKSNCIVACAAVWLPLVAASGAVASGKFNLVLRDDGSNQWSYEAASRMCPIARSSSIPSSKRGLLASISTRSKVPRRWSREPKPASPPTRQSGAPPLRRGLLGT
jgi:hypothetical protein